MEIIMTIYILSIFLSAFLLFQIQPMIAKYILPWFGGSPAVWTTCMLFFQILLLGGYAYAHLSASRLRPRRQAAVHLLLLALAPAVLQHRIIPNFNAEAEGVGSLEIIRRLLDEVRPER